MGIRDIIDNISEENISREDIRLYRYIADQLRCARAGEKHECHCNNVIGHARKIVVASPEIYAQFDCIPIPAAVNTYSPLLGWDRYEIYVGISRRVLHPRQPPLIHKRIVDMLRECGIEMLCACVPYSRKYKVYAACRPSRNIPEKCGYRTEDFDLMTEKDRMNIIAGIMYHNIMTPYELAKEIRCMAEEADTEEIKEILLGDSDKVLEIYGRHRYPIYPI